MDHIENTLPSLRRIPILHRRGHTQQNPVLNHALQHLGREIVLAIIVLFALYLALNLLQIPEEQFLVLDTLALADFVFANTPQRLAMG